MLVLGVLLVAARAALLDPFSTSPPMNEFSVITHPKLPQFIAEDLLDGPLPTNKFYTNSFFGDQALFAHPYVLKPHTDVEGGFAITHTSLDNKVLGGETPAGASRYYFSAILENIGVGSVEGTSSREVVYLDHFSTHITFYSGGGSFTAPVVRGMAYVTSLWHQCTPLIFTTHAILTVNGQNTGAQVTDDRFLIVLNNGDTWVLYASDIISFSFSNNQLVASAFYGGSLRLAKVMDGDASVLDMYHESYPTGGTLADASVNGDLGTYQITWSASGPGDLLHFASVHITDTLVGGAQPTSLTMESTTKGKMVGVTGTHWEIQVDLMPDVGYLPDAGPDADKLAEITAQLTSDINDSDFSAGTNLDSNYFSGKCMHKYSQLCVMAQSLGETTLTSTCVAKLKTAFAVFLGNTQQNPLRYDSTWHGVVSEAGISDPGADFGNTYYNDHHYHWGYFIVAAANLASLDATWKAEASEWVENLLRDVVNPSAADPYFVPFRNFDWFSGHSWSNGLFEVTDGKDQESTSEEIHFLFGLKLWGLVTANKDMEDLGRLMLSVASKAINRYFLMHDDNDVHPAGFIANKVTGIYFDNKCDYATWFGINTEYIHGIQMLPMTAASEFVREPTFVAEEWGSLLAAIAPGLVDGWKSILYTNYAIINKQDAYTALLTAPLDDGLMRSWALYWAATRPATASPKYYPIRNATHA